MDVFERYARNVIEGKMTNFILTCGNVIEIFNKLEVQLKQEKESFVLNSTLFHDI